MSDRRPPRLLHAVVLAAGTARRFGAPKLLVPLRDATGTDAPVLRHVLAALDGLPRHVALRADAPPALAALVPVHERVVVQHPAPELSDSIRAAVAAAGHAGAAAVVICLADQPRLSRTALDALRAAWASGHTAARPRYLEEPDVPGHPLLLDRVHFPLAAQLAGDAGFGPVLRAAGVPVHVVDVPGRNPDLDTPDDLARL
jgi:CTP:molybdopterin cytidylyltransferase MocA